MDRLGFVYFQLRSTWNQHPPGPLLPLSLLADMAYQQQLWIILYLFLVKIFHIFQYFSLQLYFYSGGHKDGSGDTNEILSYDSTSDSWDVAGQMTKPRHNHGLGLHIEVSKVCP